MKTNKTLEARAYQVCDHFGGITVSTLAEGDVTRSVITEVIVRMSCLSTAAWSLRCMISCMSHKERRSWTCSDPREGGEQSSDSSRIRGLG